jgi:6-phosphogluconolactonase (cycloisomerase 2 family)
MRRPLFWAISILVLSLALPAAAGAKRSLYVAGTAEVIAPFDIAADGNLTALGAPISTGVGTSTPIGASMTPDGRFLYTSNFGSDDVSAFSVNPDGTLTALPGSPFPTGTGEQIAGTAVAPSGDRLYVADRGLANGRIFGFKIAADGSLSPLPNSPYAADFQTQFPAVSPDGKRLYAGHNGGLTVDIFSIAADGSLAPAGSGPAGSEIRNVSFTPDGRFLYGALLTDDTVSGFSVASDGSLTAVPGPPATLEDGPLFAQVSPDGRRVYSGTIITSGAVTSDRIGGFDIAGDGSLTPVPGSPLTGLAGGAVRSLAITPTSGTLYVGDEANGSELTELGIAGDGSLAPLAGSPFNPAIGDAASMGAVVTPNQGPAAAATFTRDGTMRKIAFSGAGSSDSDGSVANFVWDFGDGTTATGVTAEHTYSEAGVFKPTLTVTDNEGCSDKFVFTGQTASCNGGSKGKAELTIDLQPPVITISGKRSQKLKKRVLVRAACDEKCTITGRGKIGKAKILKLTRELDAGTSRAFKLKLTGKARKKAAQIIRGGRKARAKLSFSAADGSGNSGSAGRTLKLK